MLLSKIVIARKGVPNVSAEITLIQYGNNENPGILSPLCKEGNSVSSKAGALVILKAILDEPIDPDSIPYETDERTLKGHDSIISASPLHARTAQKPVIENENSSIISV